MAPIGSIRKRVEDANFNIQHGRYEAALALLLVAVDGSSKKVYPEGMKSLINPKNEMKNKERYTRFLGVRLRQILGFALDDSAYHEPNLIQFMDGMESPEEQIYTKFRCNDLHESGLPEDLRYVYEPEGVANKLEIAFSENGVRFSSGFLRLLEKVITEAPCNGDEFNVQYYRLKPEDDNSLDSFIDTLSQRHNISSGRVWILTQLIQFIGPYAYQIGDEDLSSSLALALEKNFPEGARTALSLGDGIQPVCLQDDKITDFCIKIVRDIMGSAKLINVTEKTS